MLDIRRRAHVSLFLGTTCVDSYLLSRRLAVQDSLSYRITVIDKTVGRLLKLRPLPPVVKYREAVVVDRLPATARTRPYTCFCGDPLVTQFCGIEERRLTRGVRNAVGRCGGSVWESNPPEPPKAPLNGFEDRAGHQTKSAPSRVQALVATASISTRTFFGSPAA